MRELVVLGFIGLLSTAVAAPQVCSIPDLPPCPCSSQANISPESRPWDQDVPIQNDDGAIRVIIQKDDSLDNLQGFQSYPIPGGIIYLHSNPDVIIQPPPILLRPPQPKPIQPPPLEVQPPPLPAITPPPFYVRPPPLPPVNVPSICVKPKPLPPITPPPMMVKPPCLQPIQPPPITIRQPELPEIKPPKIVVRPPAPANIQPPPILFKTSVLENRLPDVPLPHYPSNPCGCEDS